MTDYVLNAEYGVIGAKGFTHSILHINVPELPEFSFEWHPNVQKVFVFRRSQPDVAEPVMDKVNDRNTAERVVRIWSSGYLTHKLETNLDKLNGACYGRSG